MDSSIRSVGAIGRGAFGLFALSLIPSSITAHSFNLGDSEEVFLDVARCDVVVLAIPLDAYEGVLLRLAPHLHHDSLLVDVCSVKLRPTEIIHKLLPKHKNILLSHPLFGPETYTQDKTSATLVVCSKLTGKSKGLIDYCAAELSMEVVRMTPDAHDKEMMFVHALTFFIARGLRGFKLDQLTLETPSFRHIKQLAHLDKVHSQELFETIELGNPYAAKARGELMVMLERANASLERL